MARGRREEAPLSEIAPLDRVKATGLTPSKRARREQLLLAISSRVAAGEDVADATAAEFLDGPFTPYSRRPAEVRPRTYWLARYGMLLREVAPDLVENAKSQALTRFADNAAAAVETLGKFVEGDFPRTTKEDIGAARERREAAQFVLESLGAGPKRFGGATQAVQVNVGDRAADRERQLSAERIADLSRRREEWQYRRGLAEGRGEAFTEPEPRYRATRIEDMAAGEASVS